MRIQFNSIQFNRFHFSFYKTFQPFSVAIGRSSETFLTFSPKFCQGTHVDQYFHTSMDTLLGHVLWYNFRHRETDNGSCRMSATYDVDGAQHSPPSRHGLVVNNVKPSHGSEGHADTSTSNCAYNSTETSDKILMEGEQIESTEVRKSCDYCVMGKRKCDGNGTRTCRSAQVIRRCHQTTVNWYSK